LEEVKIQASTALSLLERSGAKEEQQQAAIQLLSAVNQARANREALEWGVDALETGACTILEWCATDLLCPQDGQIFTVAMCASKYPQHQFKST
jgi:hypothetical protein